MREMSATLTEAATRWGGRAEVTMTLVDRRARWESLRAGSGGGDWAALTADGDPAAGGAIVRARVDGAGAIHIARVTDPADPDQWAAWEQLAGAGIALAGSDVALARAGAGRIRLFYAAAEAGAVAAVQCLSSTDGGLNWSSTPSAVIGGLADAPHLAAAEDHCFVFSAGRVRAYVKPWGLGSWAQDGYWTALQLDDRQGVAAAYDAEAALYRLIVCGDGCAALGTFDPATATWWGPLRIAPGGEQAAPSAANPRGPGAAIGPEGCYFAWVDDHQGSPEAWVQPIVRRSLDGVPPDSGGHTGDEVALDLPATTQRRVALCYVAGENAVYAANDVSACRGVVCGECSGGRCVVCRGAIYRAPTVMAYDRQTDEDGSRLRIEIAGAMGAGAAGGGSRAKASRYDCKARLRGLSRLADEPAAEGRLGNRSARLQPANLDASLDGLRRPAAEPAAEGRLGNRSARLQPANLDASLDGLRRPAAEPAAEGRLGSRSARLQPASLSASLDGLYRPAAEPAAEGRLGSRSARLQPASLSASLDGLRRPAAEPAAEGRLGNRSARLQPASLSASLDASAAVNNSPLPLQTIILSRGYRTAAGAETVALDPHYILSATTLSGQNGGRVLIEAVDGWGLLGLWRPEEPLSWQNRAIRWIIAALCARVGLRYADDAGDALGEAINLFTLLPTQTAAEGVRALLDLAGAAARFDPDGALVAFAWETYDPAQALAIGANGEIRQGRYEARLPLATGWRAAGQGVAASGDDCAASMALGLRLLGSAEDYRAVNTRMAERLRVWRLARALMASRRDQAAVPLRPDAELWDLAALTDPALGEGPQPRVVVALRERYDPAAGRYETTVGMGERG